MTAPLAVLGASGHAKVVVDIVERMGTHRIVGVFDDDPAKWGMKVLGHQVVGGIEEFLSGWQSRCAEAVLGIGNNRVRQSFYRRLAQAGFRAATAVHPSAAVAPDVALGEGSVVMAQAVVNPGSRIGPCAVINTSASVDHDCLLGECVFIAPGARLGGSVRIGDLSFVGIGASVIQGRTIGRNVTVGAGSVVLTDMPDDVTVVGVPAHVVGRADRHRGGRG
jgi:sugar O-acyltransferase (sialic acid O-acetyltransferase NeuD family)